MYKYSLNSFRFLNFSIEFFFNLKYELLLELVTKPTRNRKILKDKVHKGEDKGDLGVNLN